MAQGQEDEPRQAPDARNKHSRPQFWQLARRCCQLAASVDVAFFFLFHLLGSPILAWINVASVSLYLVALYLINKRRNGLAIALIWTEVIIHAALGTLLIGWDSGFHYFLLMFIPALFAGMTATKAWKAVAGLWAFYVLLFAMMWFVEPLQPISSNALLGVFLFNLTVVFCMFSYLSLFYVNTVSSAQRKLQFMATTDSLTRLFNRRHLIELAEKEIARCDRNPLRLTFLLLDIDHFKHFNDRYGHDVGDRVLERMSVVLASVLRTQDSLGRWGGEEFLAILPDTDAQQALLTAERIRVAVEEDQWECDGMPLSVTLSIGVSEYRPGEDLSVAIARADRALYQGKEGGRNRVELELT
ncbi:GGDEF domain-containing protein [Halopseudomonas pelagia]|uniref:GGDEF domain-containing protein n=1 Tax=Halopseudomonas pelagia TaxID=553151 RepID=UPI00039E26F6|nr:diguanylate cyclase [Halopseudomonas pelagia]|tara:strand:- start:418 stop:1488 length:1071 start_codon:yes stop_codon:yes gene_type:complete